MKILPPELIIPEDNPYKNDLFNRKPFADSLSMLLKNIDNNIVLCINAQWGDGKTSFAKMWMKDLINQGIKSIYFNAYEHDFFEDPFIAFSSEIIKIANINFKENKSIQSKSKNFKKKAVVIGKKLLSTSLKIGIKAASLGIIKDTDIEAIESIREDIASDTKDILSKIVENKIDDYTSLKESYNSFMNELSELGKEIRNVQKMPLIIIIDELDRCRPDFALILIERIKHLFTVENISFVLLTNLHQIENYVKTIYGNNIDAYNYLHKFFTLITTFPKESYLLNKTNQSKYFEFLANYHGIYQKTYDMGDTIVKLINYYNFSLREIEKLFTLLSIYYSNLPDNRLTIPIIIGFLSVIKIQFPEIFKDLSLQSISYQVLIDKANMNPFLNKLENYEKSWFINILKYVLLNDDEFSKLQPEDDILKLSNSFNRFNLDRKNYIQLFCDDLTRFIKT